jgi:hypothetical protein
LDASGRLGFGELSKRLPERGESSRDVRELSWREPTSTPVWLTGDPADCTSVSNGNEQEWEPTVTLPADASWIVVEATRASSDRLLSAPIWFQ